jgi:hypothetical protein
MLNYFKHGDSFSFEVRGALQLGYSMCSHPDTYQPKTRFFRIIKTAVPGEPSGF